MAEPALSEQDYADIEAAVMETARGRWFLAEYARRNRNADTLALLSRLDTLEERIGKAKTDAGESHLRLSLNDMAAAIARTKVEIAAIRAQGSRGAPFEDASSELDAIVASTEKATGDILSAAETLQEIGFALRETGVDPSACDLIDTKATDIYTACSFQDVTGQRTRKVVEVLRYLEHRIDALLNAWGGVVLGESAAPLGTASAAAPMADSPEKGLGQTDIDLFMHDRELDDLVFLDPGAPLPDAQPVTETHEDLLPAATGPVSHAASLPAEPSPLEPLQSEPLPQAAMATAAAALALPAPAPEPPGAASAATGEAPLAPVDVPGLPQVGEIEKLSFVEKAALFS